MTPSTKINVEPTGAELVRAEFERQKALLLAGGYATRLRPLTETTANDLAQLGAADSDAQTGLRQRIGNAMAELRKHASSASSDAVRWPVLSKSRPSRSSGPGRL